MQLTPPSGLGVQGSTERCRVVLQGDLEAVLVSQTWQRFHISLTQNSWDMSNLHGVILCV